MYKKFVSGFFIFFTLFSIVHAQGLKQKIKDKNSVYGGFVTIPAVQVVENLAIPKKLDFVWIDAEHSSMTISQVQSLIIAAENKSTAGIIRVPKNGIENIKPYVGTGAVGIVVPNIKTAADAKLAVDSIKYPPLGKRHVGPERANDYLKNVDKYRSHANQKTLVILMIETKEAVENIEEIAKVEGVDVLHIGPYDLSLSLGVDRNSQQLKEAIATVEKTAQAKGIALGSYAANINSAKKLRKKGYLFFTVPGDMQLLQSGVDRFFLG